MVSSQTVRRHEALHGDLQTWINGFDHLHVDLGTGDGRYALQLAQRHPELAVLGVDTCLNNLAKRVRKDLPNLQFLTGDATAMPAWLHGRATGVSINFPFGSLLRAVVDDARAVLAVAAPGTRIEIRVNASAGTEYGLSMAMIQACLAHTLRHIAPCSGTVQIIPLDTLRAFPTTWAKRLAYGRPSQAIVATATYGE